MAASMLIKAAPGKIVKGPGGVVVTDDLPSTVPCTTFWRRRLRCGDVLPGDAAPASAPAVDPAAADASTDATPSVQSTIDAAPQIDPAPGTTVAPTPPIRRRRRDDSGEES